LGIMTNTLVTLPRFKNTIRFKRNSIVIGHLSIYSMLEYPSHMLHTTSCYDKGTPHLRHD